MDFGNKMDFLIRLSQIKNKELAAEMPVDRSIISLLRTGKRGMPKNKLHIKAHCGKLCKTYYYRYPATGSCRGYGFSRSSHRGIARNACITFSALAYGRYRYC